MVDKNRKNQPGNAAYDLPGYVGFDDLGNAVWQWAPQRKDADEPVDETWNLLKSLDNPNLSLEDSMIAKAKSGFDPYNSAGRRSR